jgi:hypothetical protein
MSDRSSNSYVPLPGAPLHLVLVALIVTTGLPGLLFAFGITPPIWLTSILFALVFATVMVVPRLNARQRGPRRGVFAPALLTIAIVLPFMLLYPTGMIPGMRWSLLAGAGVQVLLLLYAVFKRRGWL